MTLVAAPATASAATSCPVKPVTHPFSPWGDSTDYFLAPNGGFEQSSTGWTLRGSATVQAGNEPFKVNGPLDAKSLRLAASSSATSPSFCLGPEHRTMRLFTNAATSSSMDVDVIVDAPAAAVRTVRLATVTGAARWAPSPIVRMLVNDLSAQLGSTLNVRLRFTPRGTSSATIDDVFVDPQRMS